MSIILGVLGVIAFGGAVLVYEKAVVDTTKESGVSDYYTDLAKAMYEARKQKKTE